MAKTKEKAKPKSNKAKAKPKAKTTEAPKKEKAKAKPAEKPKAEKKSKAPKESKSTRKVHGDIAELEEAMKGNDFGRFLFFGKKRNELRIRIVQEPTTWATREMHEKGMYRSAGRPHECQKPYVNTDVHGKVFSKEGNCPTCDLGHTAREYPYFLVALIKDYDDAAGKRGTPDRVYLFMPKKTVFDQLVAWYKKKGTLLDRDYTVQKSGEGFDTSYLVMPEDKIKRASIIEKLLKSDPIDEDDEFNKQFQMHLRVIDEADEEDDDNDDEDSDDEDEISDAAPLDDDDDEDSEDDEDEESDEENEDDDDDDSEEDEDDDDENEDDDDENEDDDDDDEDSDEDEDDDDDDEENEDEDDDEDSDDEEFEDDDDEENDEDDNEEDDDEEDDDEDDEETEYEGEVELRSFDDIEGEMEVAFTSDGEIIEGIIYDDDDVEDVPLKEGNLYLVAITKDTSGDWVLDSIEGVKKKAKSKKKAKK